MSAVAGPERRSVLGRLSGFAPLHALNALVNLSYTFIQLIVFSRVLPPDGYARVVFLTAVGFYVLPLSQAVGRANFVALRETRVRGEASAGGREVVALLLAQAALLVAISVGSSYVLGWSSTSAGVAEWLYLLFCLFTNFWYFDLQSAVWAIELGRTFELLSLLRRLANFVALALIWFTQDFLFFGLFTFATNIVFLVLLARMIARSDPNLRPWLSMGEWRELKVVAHLKLLWSSFLSTLSELLVLNSPYALLTARFGVGPALVAFDTVMKLARLAMTVSRNLAEIALPKQSRHMVEGDRRSAARIFLLTTLLSTAGGLVVGGVVALYGPVVFSLLLGPNNVLPAGVAYVGAVIIVAGSLYQPASYFLSFNNMQGAIRKLTIAALIGFFCYSVSVFTFQLNVVETLYVYAVYLAATAAFAIHQCWRVLRHDETEPVH